MLESIIFFVGKIGGLDSTFALEGLELNHVLYFVMLRVCLEFAWRSGVICYLGVSCFFYMP